MKRMNISGSEAATAASGVDGEGPLRVPLAGSLGLKHAQGVCERLRDALAASDTVEIDLSNLAGLDTSIAQLLVATRKSAMRQGKALTFAGAPAGPVRDFLAAIGLVGADGAARTADKALWGAIIDTEARAA